MPGKKILIIDDDAVLLRLLVNKLRQEGYVVSTEKNGVKGLATAMAEHPDLILLDIIMPKMDGVTVLKKLRRDTWGCQVPVIILSNLGVAETTAAIGVKTETFLIKSDRSLEDIVKMVRKKFT